jgi:hypothetical protein
VVLCRVYGAVQERCSRVMPRCRSQLPPHTQPADGRSVMCWLHAGVGADRANA